MPKALITGITGQDGSYLAELLLARGYQVHGLVRWTSTPSTTRINGIVPDPHEAGARLFLHEGDLSSTEALARLLAEVAPDEIYHLGAQSHVRVSFDTPEHTGDITGLGTVRLLEAVRCSGLKVRFYNASSSEMFGSTAPPQSETSPLQPRSPYAAAKVYAYWMTANYREGYGLFACNGILFNHESPRRGETFVSRKITLGVANILAGKQKKLYLGNLEARRDWGYAPDYVEAMWRMLQLDRPEDLVLGTGEAHTVKEFVQEAFGYVGLNWKNYVEIDPRFMRPTEVDFLLADASRARQRLGWEPKIRFRELVRIMMDADLETLGLQPLGEGQEILKSWSSGWHQASSQSVAALERAPSPRKESSRLRPFAAGTGPFD
jgi:GDPmannose 4,6-dehydratase